MLSSACVAEINRLDTDLPVIGEDMNILREMFDDGPQVRSAFLLDDPL